VRLAAPSFSREAFAMRAEMQNLSDEIEQSLSLLRRYL
jgi:hypothetical protein